MKVELSRFRVKPGKSERVDEWLAMLNLHLDEAVKTLEREQMNLEVIFREIIDGVDHLRWFSVQGEQGEPCDTSPFAIDVRHLEYWEECIDEEYGRHDAQPQVVMVPTVIANAMAWDSPMKSVTTFERRALISKRKAEL